MSLSGIKQVDSVMLGRMISDCIKSGRNLIIFGPAGSGKTEISIHTTHTVGIPNHHGKFHDHIYLNLSVCTPPELVGLPQIEDGVSKYALPGYMPTDRTHEHDMVMIVDEIDKADSDLQNPMLEMFQFKSINGTKLKIKSVIATANLPDEGAFSRPLSTALANRCQMVQLHVNSKEWVDWAATKAINSLVVGYISRNGVWLTKRSHKEDNTAYCQPSPRAWTNAAMALDSIGKIDTSDKVEYGILQVASYVGEPAAVGFATYIEHAHKFEPIVEEIIKKGATSTTLEDANVEFVVSLMALGRLSSFMGDNYAKRTDKDVKEEAARLFRNVYGWFTKAKVAREIVLGSLRSTMSLKQYSEYDLIRLKELQEIYQAMER
jgi:hypothetical protein